MNSIEKFMVVPPYTFTEDFVNKLKFRITKFLDCIRLFGACFDIYDYVVRAIIFKLFLVILYS